MEIFVDYESFFSDTCSVREQGAVMYCQDPSFDAYLLSIVDSEGYEWVGHPRDAKEYLEKNMPAATAIAHNAVFDAAVHSWVCNKYGIAGEPREWLCSASAASYCQLPRALSGAVKMALGIDLSKNMRNAAKGKTEQDLKDLGMYDEMVEYALKDSVMGMRLWNKVKLYWPQHEREIYKITHEGEIRGMQVDTKLLEEYINIAEASINLSISHVPWVTYKKPKVLTPKKKVCTLVQPELLPNAGYTEEQLDIMSRAEEDPTQDWGLGFDKGPLSRKGFLEQCFVEGIKAPASLSKDDPSYLRWVDKHGDKHTWIQAIQNYRSVNSFHSKLNHVKRRCDSNGIFHCGLMYFGAHTGRWSGGRSEKGSDSGGFNLQNMPKDNVIPDGTGEIYFRNLITARPGHKLIISDLSQIEPRVLAYLAKDFEFLKHVASGQSPYEAHARASMGWTGGTLKKEDPGLYALAKARVLALGYQCGSAKFVAMAKSMAGLDITLQESEDIVQDYRSTNPKIKGVWDALSSRAKNNIGGAFAINLLSGRRMVYYDVKEDIKLRDDGKDFTELSARQVIGGKYSKIYGGLLTENLVQATARDIFAHGILLVRQAGIPILFSVHDELVVEVPEDKVDWGVKTINKCLTTCPVWCPGLPLACETIVTDKYTK